MSAAYCRGSFLLFGPSDSHLERFAKPAEAKAELQVRGLAHAHCPEDSGLRQIHPRSPRGGSAAGRVKALDLNAVAAGAGDDQPGDFVALFDALDGRTLGARSGRVVFMSASAHRLRNKTGVAACRGLQGIGSGSGTT